MLNKSFTCTLLLNSVSCHSSWPLIILCLDIGAGGLQLINSAFLQLGRDPEPTDFRKMFSPAK